MDAPVAGEAAITEASILVRRLLTQATRNEVWARYEIGQLLCAIRGARQAYGEHAVERIATNLDVKVHALYACAAVADNWSPDELRALSMRTGRHGEPLAWSHWVALTAVAAKIPRKEMAERCLAEGWTVRELRRAITVRHHEGSVGRNDRAPAGPGQSVRVALVEGAQDAARAARALRVFTGALKARVGEEAWDAVSLARALRAHEELRENADAALAYLRQLAGSSGQRVSSGVRLRVEAPAPAHANEDLEVEDDDRGKASRGPARRGTKR